MTIFPNARKLLLILSFAMLVTFCRSYPSNYCGPHGFRCISKTSYQMCPNSGPRRQTGGEPIFQCPANSTCNEINDSFCIDDEPDNKPTKSSKTCKPKKSTCKKSTTTEPPTREMEEPLPTILGATIEQQSSKILVNDTSGGSCSDSFHCTRGGNFKDTGNGSCYWFCDVGPKGENFFPVHRVCPPNHVFDEGFRECVLPSRIKRDCQCMKTTETTTVCAPETTEKHVSYSIIVTSDKFADPAPQPPPESQEFKCPDSGVFPDQSNCTMFYICHSRRQLAPKQYEELHVQCPEGTSFNPVTRKCASQDLFEVHAGNPTDSKTAYEVGKEGHMGKHKEEFKCKNEGRFPDPGNCGGYYLCYRNDNGGFYSLKMQCPRRRMFVSEEVGCGEGICDPNRK